MDAINNAGNINPISPQNLSDVAAGKTKETAPVTAGNNTPAPDRVEISRQAKVISKAAIALNELPDVRTELVNKAVQERVNADNRVPANLLAQKLLFEDIK